MGPALAAALQEASDEEDEKGQLRYGCWSAGVNIRLPAVAHDGQP